MYSPKNPSEVVVYLDYNGALIMQDSQSNYVWNSDPSTNNSSPYQLKIQNTSELTIIDNNANVVWSSIKSYSGTFMFIFLKKH